MTSGRGGKRVLLGRKPEVLPVFDIFNGSKALLCVFLQVGFSFWSQISGYYLLTSLRDQGSLIPLLSMRTITLIFRVERGL